jgi:Flp pilus assembly protein TadG
MCVKRINNSDGAVLVIVALVIVILIGVTAFAIDFGIVFVTNKQLYNAADAGALAGARALGYYRCVESGTPDCTPVNGVSTIGTASEAVKLKATEAVGNNSAFESPGLDVADADLVLGKWENASQTFTSVESESNAVKVTVRKEEGADNNGTVNAYFGRIFTVTEYSTRKESIAALTGLGKADPGELVPLTISTSKVCDADIRFTGNDSCAGWTSLIRNEKYDKKEVQAVLADLSTAPGVSVGYEIGVGGGVTDTIVDFRKVWEDHLPHPWEVLVPVYSGSCLSPNSGDLYKVVGFATLSIYDVITNGPDKGVYGKLVCGKYEDERGGGSDFGTLGTIPGLVR